jgi:hypothetical protein
MRRSNSVHSFHVTDDVPENGLSPKCQLSLSLTRSFRVPDDRLWHRITRQLAVGASPLSLDLLDVARVLFLADCAVRRPKRHGPREEDWKRRLRVVIPVREFERWNLSATRKALVGALAFATGDDWDISFVPKRTAGMSAQLPLPIYPPRQYRVCLFSEGADSLCGLALRLRQDSDATFVAVSGLTQYQCSSRIRRASRRLAEMNGGRVLSLAVPLYRREHRLRAGEEPSQRTRSFLLLVLGTIAALLIGQEEVEVYENGIEAISLPGEFCSAPARFSRAMHPIFLERMSEFIVRLTGQPFRFVAPFLFHTKGDLVRAARAVLPDDMLTDTISCAHFPQRHAGPDQCGECPGCVLRRLAFFSANLGDSGVRYRADVFSGGCSGSPDTRRIAWKA